MKVDNAIIMAAGTSSRFAPLSIEKPKGLLEVKGEILIERQIKQLKEAGIEEIIVVVGYKKELFDYLKEKYGVILIENDMCDTRNNHYSLYAAREYLKNSYICSADNYYVKNIFTNEEEACNYATVYSEGYTDEWCVWLDDEGYINKIKVGAADTWYMFGQAFFSSDFSKKYIEIVERDLNTKEIENKYWEDILKENLDVLKMKIKPFDKGIIEEFDSLEELRKFDKTYINDTRSKILKNIAKEKQVEEKDIVVVDTIKKEGQTEAIGFKYKIKDSVYEYLY